MNTTTEGFEEEEKKGILKVLTLRCINVKNYYRIELRLRFSGTLHHLLPTSEYMFHDGKRFQLRTLPSREDTS